MKVAFFQDINRAESYGKRMQKEFEREYETVGICQDIISASEEGEEEESREGEGESDKEQKSILSEGENVQNIMFFMHFRGFLNLKLSKI